MINLGNKQKLVGLVIASGCLLLSGKVYAMALEIVPPQSAEPALQPTNPSEQITQTLELYGALRLSADYSDSDVSSAEADTNPLLTNGGVSISSNTSMFGIRGSYRLDKPGYRVLGQIEQQFDADDTDSGDVLSTRDTFLGLESPFGTFLIGRVNTPFKNMGVSYLSYFNTTVADSHAILGAPSGGPGGRLDLLGSNSITWQKEFKEIQNLSISAQYSADQRGSINTVDNNGRQSYSASFSWRPQKAHLSGAYIHYADAGGIGSLDAYRLAATYRFKSLQVGGIYEDIDAKDRDNISRQAYGAQIFYTLLPKWILGGQWNHAHESKVGDDAANQYSLILFHPVNDYLLLHVAYSMTRNERNASYRGVDYAHGDKVGALPGGTPQAFSIGAQFKF